MRRILAVLGIVASGCATTGLPRCPREGGPPWRAVESEHFVVYTDGPSKKAAALARDLEFTRGALAHIMVPGWEGPPGQIAVVMLEGEGHFEVFFPGSIAGAYTQLLFQPLVLMDGASSLRSEVLIKHELTHYVVDGYIPLERMPRWVGEGLATFTETMDVDRDRGLITVGKGADERVIHALARYYPQRIMLRYNTVLLSADAEGAFYAASWVKVHYLVNHHGPAFGQFLHGLHQGRSEAEAWAAAFPDLPQDRLEPHLTEYVKSGKHRVVTLRVPVPETTVVERPVEDADVHAWRALLYALRKKHVRSDDERALELGRAEVAEAQRQDPAHARALAAELLLGGEVSVERARAATAAHPESWLAWFLLHEAQRRAGDAAGAAAAFEEAVRRASGNPAIRLQGDRPAPGHS
jgi:hypothetical protein